MIYARIASTGSCLPQTVLSNDDIAKMVDTSDEWIQQRTGIKQRHIVKKEYNENVAQLGINAAKIAIEDAGIKPEDIEMVIVATCSADKVFPATACLIQEGLGIPPCPAFDVQAACAGFIYALTVAEQFIATGNKKRVLIVGAEAMTQTVDWKDRSVCILFGDGAGAAVLEASDEPGVLSTHLKADGKYKDQLYLNNAHMHDNPFIHMEGNAVFRLAVQSLGDIAMEALEANNMTGEDLDWVVPHQANIRIIQATAKKLGLPMEKVVVTVDKHANTSGASVPMALDTAIRDGRIKRGQNLLLEAFGGGLSWGSALIKY